MLPGVTKFPTRAGSLSCTDTASLPGGTWIALSPMTVSPKAALSTYWPGGMSVRARSASFSGSTSVRAPAGTAAEAVWVSVSSLRRTASFTDVPAGISAEET